MSIENTNIITPPYKATASMRRCHVCFLTQVSGSDGLQAHHLQSSRPQHQLTAPRVEVLLPRKQTTTCQSSDVTQCSQKELKVTHTHTHTLSRSVRRVRMSVVMEGMSFTHWQYSRNIRISSSTVLSDDTRSKVKGHERETCR